MVQTASETEPALWDLVGDTPLLPMPSVGEGRLALKAEWMNPGGSVKDRAARAILRDGLRTGHLPGRRLLDATSGNTGIAYAMLGAAAGVGVTICLPANASPERKTTLAAYGAEIVETDPLEGTDGAIDEARGLAAKFPDRYWYADQYRHPANPEAHVAGTGPELWAQTEGRITHVVCGIGTSGTAMGLARYLHARRPEIRIVGVQPDGPFHGLEGLKHMATACVPAIYDARALDETVFVATEAADRAAIRLAREHGLLVGWSTGAALVAAEGILRDRSSPETFVVAIGPDGGDRYLSQHQRLGIQ